VTLNQAMDACPSCHTKIEWYGSRAAAKRQKAREKRAADQRAKEKRDLFRAELEQHDNKNVLYLYDLARASSVNGFAKFTHKEAVSLVGYEKAYGAKTVRDVIDRCKQEGSRGSGLIDHVLNTLDSQRFAKSVDYQPPADEDSPAARLARKTKQEIERNDPELQKTLAGI